ncbi:ABC transporter ATP-binding protein/permease [Legionella rowbothamii]|uniref:ABC transporter ATP-binding protein/permease n=1 Tax=Legionella rowbothamii TaxID=96229 RepID=UPI00105535EA|nr:ATP-binding cassette domain-containing protein [Legionella rowbothamii]
MNNPPIQPSYTKNATQYLLAYFLESDDKWRARLLLAGSILSILTISGLSLCLGWWCFPNIYAALMAKDTALLLTNLAYSLFVSGGMACFQWLAYDFKNKLSVSWRNWLYKKTTEQYLLGKTNYLEISRSYKNIDNPEQRIQEDIHHVVDSFLDLTLGFINNFTNLIIYTTLLYLAGSTLSFTMLGLNIVIPGFLVWTALAVGIGTSLVGYFINKPLHELTTEETISQSNLRTNLLNIRNFAEEIAIERGEQYHADRLEKQMDELSIKTTQRLSIQNRTATFNIFNGNLQMLVPFFAAAPLYFNDLLSLEAFYTVGFYFSMMTSSLSWFIESFEKINRFQTSLGRVLGLQEILDKNNTSTQKIIRIVSEHEQDLVINNLNLKLHNEDKLLVKGLNLRLTPGVNTIFQSPSGTGKSSIYKAIGGTWLAGEGEIIVPKSLDALYFLPQRPYIPSDTLRNILSYPDVQCSYSDTELLSALDAVNLGAFTDKLDQKIENASLGEQQRIAFARIFLRKPDWVFLDESTASLDEDVEKLVYDRLRKLLPNTTFESIAHRSTVKRHHDHTIFFRVNDMKEVRVEEQHLLVEEESELSIVY